jgi:hypothetical protein
MAVSRRGIVKALMTGELPPGWSSREAPARGPAGPRPRQKAVEPV